MHHHSRVHRSPRLVPLLAGAVWATACSPASDHSPDVGSLQLAVQTSVGDVVYELTNANFQIQGTTELVLSTEGNDRGSTLEQVLPVGDYSVELLPEWTLVASDDSEPRAVEATLTSPNPIELTIAAGETSYVAYRFEITTGEVTLGEGTLELGIEVTAPAADSLVFTEFMNNPAELADSSGEWIELLNTSAAAFDLDGCVLERDATSVTIRGPLIVDPGELVTFANSEEPGFVPDYVYSGLTLPNSSAFSLAIRCGDQLVDSISIDPSAWPMGAGVAASLDVDTTNPLANDAPASWCAATSPYAGDLGTPGTLNPPCE